MFNSILGGLRYAMEAVATWLRMKERKDAEETGAAKQREADKDATIEAKDDQLRKANNARRGDASKRMRDGTF
jgi:hypothetical protein